MEAHTDIMLALGKIWRDNPVSLRSTHMDHTGMNSDNMFGYADPREPVFTTRRSPSGRLDALAGFIRAELRAISDDDDKRAVAAQVLKGMF